MGKISQVSAKYIVHTHIFIEGVVDKPDVIGAIFGQTEGLLGADLELRELQKSGRIGRIEVNTEIKVGKTEGEIIIPSSLDKEETVIIAAAMETIQRIGPCNAKVEVKKIEDVRVSKRNFVLQRAKELLKELTEQVLPDSAELTDEVAQSVRMMVITEYGKERLPAGPAIADSEEIIVVEGRADVLNMLKHGFKNVIGMNGTNIPESLKELAKGKTMTLFVDGDRGGDLIIKAAMETFEVDYVIKAPDGKEVEELTQKEIHKALRNKIAAEQAKMEIKDIPKKSAMIRQITNAAEGSSEQSRFQRRPAVVAPAMSRPVAPKANQPVLSKDQKDKFKSLLEDLIGTRGAYVLDEKLNVLGKVPLTELISTVRSLKTGVFALIFDGTATKDIIIVAEHAGISYVVSMDAAVRPVGSRVQVLTANELN